MNFTPLSQADLDALKEYDTPTICNALEIVAPQRRTYGYTTENMFCLRTGESMVGYARTGTQRAMLPGPRSGADARQQRFDYFDYVAEGAFPKISIIQDLDSHRGYGAFWGEVNTNIHKALGCVGCITDGSIRDLGDIAEGFQMLAAVVGPSHAWTHLVDFNIQVNVCGMVVNHNDLVHADRHGAVVIPHDVATEVVSRGVDYMVRRESVILAAAKDPNFTVEKLKKAMGDADEIH